MVYGGRSIHEVALPALWQNLVHAANGRVWQYYLQGGVARCECNAGSFELGDPMNWLPVDFKPTDRLTMPSGQIYTKLTSKLHCLCLIDWQTQQWWPLWHKVFWNAILLLNEISKGSIEAFDLKGPRWVHEVRQSQVILVPFPRNTSLPGC